MRLTNRTISRKMSNRSGIDHLKDIDSTLDDLNSYLSTTDTTNVTTSTNNAKDDDAFKLDAELDGIGSKDDGVIFKKYLNEGSSKPTQWSQPSNATSTNPSTTNAPPGRNQRQVNNNDRTNVNGSTPKDDGADDQDAAELRRLEEQSKNAFAKKESPASLAKKQAAARMNSFHIGYHGSLTLSQKQLHLRQKLSHHNRKNQKRKVLKHKPKRLSLRKILDLRQRSSSNLKKLPRHKPFQKEESKNGVQLL